MAQLPLLGAPVARGEETEPVLTRVEPVPGAGPVAVMVLTPRSIAAEMRDDSLDARARLCLREWVDSASFRLPRPWAALDSATAARAFLALQVDVPLAPTAPCFAASDRRVNAAGVQLLAVPAHGDPAGDLASVAVVVRGRPVAPAIVARAPAALFDSTGRRLPEGHHDLRVYLAPDALAPDAHGRFRDVTLWLASVDSTRPPYGIVVPDSTLARAWSELTPWRLAELRTHPQGGGLPRLQPPNDATLRRAAALYASGDLLDAAALAARRREQLASREPASADTRFADLAVGSVFLAYGDTAGARVDYARALRSAPCLAFSDHSAYDAVLRQVRPAGARCTSMPIVRALAAGLAVPGGTQWARGQRVGAVAAMLVTAVLFRTAIVTENEAQAQFDAYRAAVGPTHVAQMLEDANVTRHEARGYLVAAVTTWVGSAAIGMVAEAIHGWRVGRERRYEDQTVHAEARR